MVAEHGVNIANEANALSDTAMTNSKQAVVTANDAEKSAVLAESIAAAAEQKASTAVFYSDEASVISGMTLFFLQRYFKQKDEKGEEIDKAKAKENISY